MANKKVLDVGVMPAPSEPHRITDKYLFFCLSSSCMRHRWSSDGPSGPMQRVGQPEKENAMGRQVRVRQREEQMLHLEVGDHIIYFPNHNALKIGRGTVKSLPGQCV